MIVFHSDLDNTLIYSYRHEIGNEKVCVETYHEKELSYMRPEWIRALKRIQKQVLFVPTTTRTTGQYERIAMGIDVPEYALVCNGGVLLRNGVRDGSWYEESLRLMSDAADEMERAKRILDMDKARCMEVRWIDRLFLFTKSNIPEQSIGKLNEALKMEHVDVFSNGSKVYVVPKKLSKGTGVMRLKAMLGADRLIAAGDSEFDKSMLLAADLGMCPQGLFQREQRTVIQFAQEEFTDKLLGHLELLLRNRSPDSRSGGDSRHKIPAASVILPDAQRLLEDQADSGDCSPAGKA